MSDYLKLLLDVLAFLWAVPTFRGAVKGALGGFGAAALVDYGAFRSWKSAEEWRAYNWKLARFRWLQGAVVGAVTGAGLGLGE